MEKRRRARINQSLNELKRILLEAKNGAAATASRKEVRGTYHCIDGVLLKRFQSV